MTVDEHLRVAVDVLGGAKKVAAVLWRGKGAAQGQKRLLDALNPGRAEKLSMSEVMVILRMARDRGYHYAMDAIAAECGYQAVPVTDAAMIDRVTAVIGEASRTLASSLATLERLQRAGMQEVGHK